MDPCYGGGVGTIPAVCRKPLVCREVTGRGTSMSWADFYRRRDSIDAALEHARQRRPGRLPLGVFSDEDELLLAMHYKWLMALTGRVELALVEQAGDPEAV